MIDEMLAAARVQLLSKVSQGLPRVLFDQAAGLPICVVSDRLELAPLVFDTNAWVVRVPLGLELTAHVSEPETCPKSTDHIPFELVEALSTPTPVHVRGSVSVPLTDLGYNAERQVRGTTFSTDEHALRITDVKVARQSGQKVIVELQCEGDYSGRLYLVGAPAFDVSRELLSVPELEWDAASAEFLSQTLPWVSSERLRAALTTGVSKGAPLDLEKVRALAIGKEMLGVRVGDAGFIALPTAVLDDVLTVSFDFDVVLQEQP